MIQRIQSIYLLLSFISNVAVLLLLAQVDEIPFHVLYGNGLLSVVSIFMCISVFLSFFSIFKYKKRIRQIQINYFNIGFNVLSFVFLLYWSLSSPGGFLPKNGVLLLILSISIVFIFLANMAIKRDERLVKSADRLR